LPPPNTNDPEFKRLVAHGIGYARRERLTERNFKNFYFCVSSILGHFCFSEKNFSKNLLFICVDLKVFSFVEERIDFPISGSSLRYGNCPMSDDRFTTHGKFSAYQSVVVKLHLFFVIHPTTNYIFASVKGTPR
jgi:hypothetical protein